MLFKSGLTWRNFGVPLLLHSPKTVFPSSIKVCLHPAPTEVFHKKTQTNSTGKKSTKYNGAVTELSWKDSYRQKPISVITNLAPHCLMNLFISRSCLFGITSQYVTCLSQKTPCWCPSPCSPPHLGCTGIAAQAVCKSNTLWKKSTKNNSQKGENPSEASCDLTFWSWATSAQDFSLSCTFFRHFPCSPVTAQSSRHPVSGQIS